MKLKKSLGQNFLKDIFYLDKIITSSQIDKTKNIVEIGPGDGALTELILQNSNYLKVIWDDGEESKFNYLWLRDNCPSAHDKDSRHRMFNILNVSTEINPKNYNLNKNGNLEIEWSEGDHKSIYDPSWLRENCYTIKNKSKYISPYKLWDNSLQNNLNLIEVDFNPIISSSLIS